MSSFCAPTFVEELAGHLGRGALLGQLGDRLVRRLQGEEPALLPARVGHDPVEPELLVDLPQLGAGDPGRRRQHDRAGPGPGLEEARVVLEPEHPELVAHVGDRHVEAQVGLVRAVLQERLGVAQAREGPLDLHADEGHHALEERLHEVEHRLHARERHLDVHLRELGLAVGAQVLVAEAAGDLEVLVEARDHQQLLEQLRRLRQRVEAAVVDARGHEVVARALRGRLAEHRGLDLVEPLLVEVPPDLHRRLVAQAEVLLQARPAQVEVAVLEADLLVGVDRVLDREDGRLRLGEDPDLAGEHLDPARVEVRVHGVGRAGGDLAHHRDDVLGAHVVGGGVGVLRHLRPRHDLAEALAVAQVDEDDAAEVAAGRGPAHEGHRLADVVVAQLPAVVGADEVAQRLSHSPSPSGGRGSSPPGRPAAPIAPCRAPPRRPARSRRRPGSPRSAPRAGPPASCAT